MANFNSTTDGVASPDLKRKQIFETAEVDGDGKATKKQCTNHNSEVFTEALDDLTLAAADSNPFSEAIFSLPVELFNEIESYLIPADILALKLTCKRLNMQLSRPIDFIRRSSLRFTNMIPKYGITWISKHDIWLLSDSEMRIMQDMHVELENRILAHEPARLLASFFCRSSGCMGLRPRSHFRRMDITRLMRHQPRACPGSGGFAWPQENFDSGANDERFICNGCRIAQPPACKTNGRWCSEACAQMSWRKQYKDGPMNGVRDRCIGCQKVSGPDWCPYTYKKQMKGEWCTTGCEDNFRERTYFDCVRELGCGGPTAYSFRKHCERVSMWNKRAGREYWKGMSYYHGANRPECWTSDGRYIAPEWRDWRLSEGWFLADSAAGSE